MTKLVREKLKSKRSLILAAFLIVSGLALAFVAFAMMGGDIDEMNSMTFTENTYTAEGSFENIYIDAAEANVQFAVSENGECYAVCSEWDKIYHNVEVEDNTLTIERIDSRKLHEHIGVYWGSMDITVYLPETEYDELYISTLSGNIEITDRFSFNDAEIHNTSGRISFSAAVKNELTTDNTSGATVLTDVNAKSIESRSVSGNIKLERCDAETLRLKSTSGGIHGSLLSDKIFTGNTTSGNINVPDTTTGGTCEITTVSGNIKITIDK